MNARFRWSLLLLCVGLGACNDGYRHYPYAVAPPYGNNVPPPFVNSPTAILTGLNNITTVGTTSFTIAAGNTSGSNPYGLTIATTTAGPVTTGDLLVCNFNDGATNTPGKGMSLLGLHPSAGATPYLIAQSNDILGCSGLAALQNGSIAATGSAANGTALVTPAGVVSTPFSSDTFAQPWSIVDAVFGGTEYLYVANGSNGTIDRITVANGVQTAFVEIATGFIGSSYTGAYGSSSGGYGAGNAPLPGPGGLVYDANIDTLYVVDTNVNQVLSIANASTVGTDGIVQTDTGFVGPAASNVSVLAYGPPLNGPISAALLSNGDIVVGNTLDPNGTNLLIEVSPTAGIVATKNVDTGPAGAIFGIIAVPIAASGPSTTSSDVIYFNDDNDNTVKAVSQ
jgi:hypothetical protein